MAELRDLYPTHSHDNPSPVHSTKAHCLEMDLPWSPDSFLMGKVDKQSLTMGTPSLLVYKPLG